MAVRIAVDALGGDHGPHEIVEGAVAAAADGIVPVLYGPPALDPRGLELVVCDEAIGMQEKPAEAVRAKPGSSLVRAVKAVGDGDAEAVVSAGNTGATLAASLLHIRRLPGCLRPGIAVVIPAANGPTVLIDAGANADARPDHLLQFAHMGVVFAQEILDVRDPLVRLLSIGEEPEKGNQLTLEAHELLAGAPLRFAGNMEGRTLLAGGDDVVVCDGFTGNVALKISESLVEMVEALLGDELSGTFSASVGYLLSQRAFRRFRRRVDYSEYGGAPLLGVGGVVIVGHGRSSAKAIRNAILLADRFSRERLVERLEKGLAGITVTES
jgi:glycerol-3-phosphate acyltransferase PlsX